MERIEAFKHIKKLIKETNLKLNHIRIDGTKEAFLNGRCDGLIEALMVVSQITEIDEFKED